ncbi:MAG: type II toxin-antitoxin system VapC family toxin [Pseudomonadota bacterium]|nr:type II toxin-antitoxin system VapC family toxin [Pseudomonadota bacterium]
MTYMLDTTTCIFLMKGKPPSVRARLISLSRERVCLSSVVVSELWFGVYNSRLLDKNRQALECFLEPFEELAYGHKADRIYGRHRAELKKSGTPVGALDMLIAAHALSEDAVLVTNNIREFSRIEGMKLEDWCGG